MENLTKQQIVLLTLLVSFVTSIATGIVTVALMNQAPIGVTQTINHVVQTTIEKAITPTESTPAVQETVVVSEDTEVVSAINNNIPSVVRIYSSSTADTSPQFVALGVIVSGDGIIATDGNALDPNGSYTITTNDNQTYPASIIEATSSQQIGFLQIVSATGTPLSGFSPATLSAEGDLKLGQAVVYLGGEANNTVATGIVSLLHTLPIESNTATSTASSTPQTFVDSVETSIASPFTDGGLLFNLSGELVGIKATYTDSTDTDLFAPVSDVQSGLSGIQTQND